MTRAIVYSAGLVVFIAATAMTLTAIALPNWISFHSPVGPSPSDDDITFTYGLHRVCSSLTSSCRPFPSADDCKLDDGYFCSLWRTTGFLMNFAAVLELVTIVAYVVVLAGGKQKRQSGWKLLAALLVVTGAVQCAAMAIVAYSYDNDDRFFVGWKLDKSWILCTVSWSVMILSAAFVTLSAFMFSSEDGYELIPSERQWG